MSSLANPPLVLGSRSLPARQKFEAWRETACRRAHELSREETMNGFPAEMHLWRSGAFGFAQYFVPQGRRWRSMSNIRPAPIDDWSLTRVTRGRQRTRWGDTIVESRPGDLRI